MSNSSLVSYTKISPNRTSPRNHKIDTISIHCAVGQFTAKQLLNLSHFVNYDSKKGSSCNYAIGHDGSIGMGVEEKDRSWCTSSRSNDHRAITIEVASEKEHPYEVTDAAYKALIELLTDICKRNSIKELKWKADKSLIGQTDKQNMTVHRWFANKACPGDYLYKKHPYIAKEVNKLLGVKKPNVVTNVVNKVVNKVTGKVTKPDVIYRVKAGGKWLPEVKNLADFAGIEGKAITDVAIKVTKGSVKYRVHIKGNGWLPYVTGYNIKDHNNGYAGNGKVIDAIEIYYSTPSDYSKKNGYLKAKYRVSPLNGNYYSYQYDNEKSNGQDGYAGDFGTSIDRLQIALD